MKDIDLAKKVLDEEDLKIVLVKDGEIIFRSIDRGIKPMYYLARNLKEDARGGALADRVIGKGAAILCAYLGIESLYTDLISENAIGVLDKNKILYEYKESSEYIMNRDKTGYCPIEKRSLDTEDPELLLERIEEFLDSLN